LEQLHVLERQLLGTGQDRVCSIAGLSGGGGMGKSALAVHFATVHRDKFPDGIIGLPVDGKTAREIACEFARRCGEEIDEEDDRSATTIMQEVFAGRRMLLIFDNADRADLKSLRPGGNNCALIVTTRDRLIPDSFGISRDGIIDLPSLPKKDARDLLKQILGAERVDAELDAADQIIEITGGLPLALQIAGSMLRGRQRSLLNYVESLREEKTRLQRLQIRGDGDLNVTASLNLSLALLEDIEVDLFACLSVCAKNGFSLQTAMVAGGLGNEWEAQDLLNRLYQLSLLNEVSENRYLFHALVRVYAQERAKTLNLWDTAAQRHAQFFTNLVETSDVKTPDIAERIVKDFDDILQAAKWLRENATSDGHKESAYQFALDLRPFFLKYNYSKGAVELMMGFQEWAEQLNDWNASVKFKIQQAKYLAIEGQLEEAEAVLKNAQNSIDRISEISQRQESQARQLNSLGGVLQKQKKIEEAIIAFERQIKITEALNDQSSLVIGLNRLGRLLQQQGKVDEALTAFERQIKIAEALNDQNSLAIGLNCLGGLLQQQGKVDEALAVFECRIKIAEALNDQSSLMIGLNCLGGLLQQQGKVDEALAAFERRIKIAEALNDQSSLVIGLNCLGGLLQQQGKVDEALTAFERQIKIAEALNDQNSLAIGLNCLGGLLQQQGKVDEALTAFERQIKIAEALNDRSSLAIGLNRLGGLLEQQERFEEAIVVFERQIKIAETLDNQNSLVRGLNCLGGLLQQQERFEEAIVVFERQIKIEENLGDSRGLTMALSGLGGSLRAKGDFPEAISILERTVTLEEKLGNYLGCAMSLRILSNLRRQQKDYRKAINGLRKTIEINNQLNNPIQNLISHTLLAETLHEYGCSLLRERKPVNQAEKALRESHQIYQQIEDLFQTAITLHSLGRLLKETNELEEAKKVLQESRDIFTNLKDNKQLLMVLNTLGGIFERTKEWDLAASVLKEGYDLAFIEKDTLSQAIISCSLGQLFAKQKGEDSCVESRRYFLHSIKLGKEVEAPRHLVKVYTAWGQALNNAGKFEEAVYALSQAFEIDEQLKSIEGLRKITQNLTFALLRLGRKEEALQYCDRAIIATDIHPDLIDRREMCINFTLSPKATPRLNQIR
jgi:tetratricopeptide (TPR) repeat protein